MGRYTSYIQDVWKIQANRKIIGINLFGVIIDNSTVFTPGDTVQPIPNVDQAISLLAQKGYDFLFILGQPVKKTRLLENHDFENILDGVRGFINQLGGQVRNAYYAPGIDKNDPYVKPNIGMWERASAENNFSWQETYFVGSELNDIKSSVKAKAKPILIRTNEDIKLKGFELTNQVKVTEFDSLLDFAKSI
jgi:histidinol phosphatase-like enzyme